MNPLIQCKTTILPLLIVLACFGLVPNTQGVNPPPDGGYPGGNTAEGQAALLSLTTGGFNTAVGFITLRSNTDGNFNTATGAGALLANTADENTATGAGALLSNGMAGFNTADGAFALFSNDSGNENVAVGDRALFSNTTGGRNTAIGSHALASSTGGNDKIAIGQNAGSIVGDASNVICIGASGLPGVSNSCFIGQIFTTTLTGGNAVFINSSGRLGLVTSSRRFKEEIRPMQRDSEALFQLEPVRFRYKKDIDPAATSQFGLVAEEVEKVNPDLVVRDKAGKPYSVRYDQVNVMLLNEFLKEHRKVEQQCEDFEAAIARQQEQIEALTAGLQKVSAQLELSKSAPQTVLNGQ
jgi:hypothetical protein